MTARNSKSPSDSHLSDLAIRSSRVPAPTGDPSLPDEPASTESDVENPDISDLTYRQQVALPVVALVPTRAEAARLSGVGESTLRRWLADPAFRRQVDLVRQQTTTNVSKELRKLLPLCVSVLADAMQSPDPTLRLRAARYALSFILSRAEADNLDEDLQELNNLAGSMKSTNP